jgi:2-hydroxy-3-keto-5-methylthiopentenyl-1-phosphate phosphatase
MKKVQRIAISILIPVMIFSGMPVFSPGDADMSGQVDVRDAILSLRAFVLSADHPERFSTGVKDTLTALQAAVGLKTVFKQNTDKNFSPDHPVYLISSYTFYYVFDAFSTISEKNNVYTSYHISPEPRPPRPV